MRLTDNEFHTKENKERACCIQEPRLQQIYDKLFELEDIEEELGIDLITLSKILKNGCYVKPWKKVWFSKVMTLQTNEFGILKLFDFNDNDYSLRNYGIDFALTKEELTDGK